MKFKSTALMLATVSMMFASSAYPQGQTGTWGFGLNAGGQVLYGDQPNEGLGFGVEGFLSVRALKFADLALSVGYGQLRYSITNPITNATAVNTTDMINIDLKGNLELISQGLFRPFVTLGGGIVNYNVKNSGLSRANETVFFGGGGFRFQVNPKFNWFVSADYRYALGDNFDSPTQTAQGTSKDGFMNIRAGVTYSPNGREDLPPQIIAGESLPYEEVQNDDGFYDYQPPSQNRSGDFDLEEKDMEEYVKLKSRIDELSQTTGSQDDEIRRLQNSVEERKRRLVSMEGIASTQPAVALRRNSSMSGFNEIYKEALTNFYNKNYSESMSLFRMLIQQYPDHKLASNCQFWVGHNLFSMTNYQEAVLELHKVLFTENSLKKDDSLYLLGKAYLKVGLGDKARESFQSLLDESPNSEFVAEARDYLRKL